MRGEAGFDPHHRAGLGGRWGAALAILGAALLAAVNGLLALVWIDGMRGGMLGVPNDVGGIVLVMNGSATICALLAGAAAVVLLTGRGALPFRFFGDPGPSARGVRIALAVSGGLLCLSIVTVVASAWMTIG